MVVIGLILFAAAVAAAIIGIVQNRNLVVDVHALGQTWSVHVYWVLVAGLVIAVVGLLGLAIMNGGAARARRLRRERRALARENKRLGRLAADNRTDLGAEQTAANAPPVPDTTVSSAGRSTSEAESDPEQRGGWFGRRRASSHHST
jgi:hypothetical protein